MGEEWQQQNGRALNQCAHQVFRLFAIFTRRFLCAPVSMVYGCVHGCSVAVAVGGWHDGFQPVC